MIKNTDRALKVRVGVDTGGTFTDFVYVVNDTVHLFKLPSTPIDPSVAIVEGLRRICRDESTSEAELEVVHGTTVGTNALLQRRGARTALVTTAGFEDVIEIGRQARPSLYDLNSSKPDPLVPEELRFGVNERVTASGEILQSLDPEPLAKLVRKLRRAGVESVAVSLLFSFVDPAHERMIEDALSKLRVPLSVSHRIHPEYREYERTSTIVVNAYLQPLLGAYLKRLQAVSPGLRVMQSSGGSISATAAASEPVRTILSGPAGGVAGALRAANAIGVDQIITFDMGGTSTDVALCDSQGVRMTNESIVSGLPVAVSMMDIHTVGAGGGSIARIDEAGSLRVGPESAGADPGPACYGRGTAPTVTDANLVLGRFGGKGLLGGDFALDEVRARDALSDLAAQMSAAAGRRLSIDNAAMGVIQVVNINMERALRAISVERGYDPRDFALIPFGGAGGLHAVELARALRIPTVIAPTSAGALSALGAVSSDVLKESSRTIMRELSPESTRTIAKSFRQMEREAQSVMRGEGFSLSRQLHDRFLSLRYKGQSFELEIPWTEETDIAKRFNAAHEKRYGYSQAENIVEIVSARVRSRGLVEQIELKRRRVAKRVMAKTPNYAMVQFLEGRMRTAIYSREALKPGMTLRSPCIVTEYSSTTLISSGCRTSVDEYGNLIIDVWKR